MDKHALSEHMRTFLLKLREDSKLSQEEVSKRSGMIEGKFILDQKTVSRIEKKPLDGDTFKVAAYMSAIGSSLDAFTKEIQSFIEKTRGNVMDQVTKFQDAELIDNTMVKVEEAKAMLRKLNHAYLNETSLEQGLDSAVSNLQGLKRKPVIGCFGHYDSGKSTLLNTIISNDFLPANYQPATSIVNLLIHKDDKPDHLSGDVALFREGFLPHMIHNPELVDAYLIEEGGKEILEKYGTHKWDEDTMDADAYISVSYLNAPILNRVWLLDTPGNLNDDASEGESKDTKLATAGVELVDGVLFLSQHSGYMNGPSTTFLEQIIKQRMPSAKEHALEHILFVKTHCHPGMTDLEIEQVESLTMKRIHKRLDTTVFSVWKNANAIEHTPSAEQLAERTVSFWRETASLRDGTLAKIDEMSLFLVENQGRLVTQRVQEIEKAILNTIKSVIADLEGKKASAEERLKEVQEQDARFRQQSTQVVTQFKEAIESTKGMERDCISEMKMYYNSLASTGNIESLINEHFDDKKEAEQGIGGIISQLLSTKLESTLKSQATPFNNQIDRLLDAWQEIAPKSPTTAQGIDMDGLDVGGFDSRSAFIGGLAGLGSLGAMAMYVSTIASNLGAYILVGKAAGVLTSLGLAGSVTSVTSFVAAIGGPITIGIVLAAAIGYAVYRLFGGKWQTALAKKIKEALDKNSPLDDVNRVIEEFWSSTRKATQSCLKELQLQTDEHIEKLYRQANTNYDMQELDDCIEHLGTIAQKIK